MKHTFRESVGQTEFRKTLAGAFRIMRNLRDARCGFSGKAALLDLDRADVSYLPAPTDQAANAAYLPFNRSKERSYTNTITCHTTKKEDDKVVPRDPSEIVGSLFHEISHALSWDAAPALHASPYNRHTPVMVGPQDYALLSNLSERVAYANVAWLLSLTKNEYPQLSHMVTPVNGHMFDFMLAREGHDIGRALAAAGDLSMLLTWGGDKSEHDESALTMEQYYQRYALRQYEYMIDTMIENDIEIPWVVRLERHDFLPVGQSFGPNIVAVGQNTAKLRPQEQALVERIHAKLAEAASVPSYEKLPLFSHELAKRGYTPESFLDMSKAAGLEVKELPVPPRRAFSFSGHCATASAAFGAMAPA